MTAPTPAQKEPYGVNVEAGKRYFWCACGRSAAQPFCDGHVKAMNRSFLTTVNQTTDLLPWGYTIIP